MPFRALSRYAILAANGGLRAGELRSAGFLDGEAMLSSMC